MECTNQIVLREEEFLEMLERLKGDLRNHNNIEDRIVRLNTTSEKKIYPVGDSSVSMMMVREEPIQEKVIIYKKPQINSTLLLIDDMEKKIKKN